MKTPLNLELAMFVFGMVITSTTNSFAQTQTVTLAINLQNPSRSYTVATNQVVQIVSLAGVAGEFPVPFVSLCHFSGTTVGTTNIGTYTGLTSVTVSNYATITTPSGAIIISTDGVPGLVTLQITTPVTANVVSNYVPADAIVIPASATGKAQIILESSPDLVNWTAANPGTYAASAGTNRFFRVRAAMSP